MWAGTINWKLNLPGQVHNLQPTVRRLPIIVESHNEIAYIECLSILLTPVKIVYNRGRIYEGLKYYGEYDLDMFQSIRSVK